MNAPSSSTPWQRSHTEGIPQLTNDDGAVINDHAGKADMIWSSFRGRIGVTTNPTMVFHLAELITPHEDLSSLVTPFSESEIDDIVKRMPPDKAPGPDGFNGHFIKKCWHLIKPDFYRLCSDFYNCQANLESINDSLTTLVPKIPNPETVNNFRPISLLNSSLKILTKLLADRLQCQIMQQVPVRVHQKPHDPRLLGLVL
jgi:hypothetical protein